MKRPCSDVSSAGVIGSSARRLVSAEDLERVCGVRYRREMRDLGLGFAVTEMQLTLRSWGFDVGRTSCAEWSKEYRHPPNNLEVISS